MGMERGMGDGVLFRCSGTFSRVRDPGGPDRLKKFLPGVPLMMFLELGRRNGWL